MSDKAFDRQTSESLSIPERRVVIKDPSELPSSFCSTPGGTIFSTTPGGEGVFQLISTTCCLYLRGVEKYSYAGRKLDVPYEVSLLRGFVLCLWERRCV